MMNEEFSIRFFVLFLIVCFVRVGATMNANQIDNEKLIADLLNKLPEEHESVSSSDNCYNQQLSHQLHHSNSNLKDKLSGNDQNFDFLDNWVKKVPAAFVKKQPHIITVTAANQSKIAPKSRCIVRRKLPCNNAKNGSCFLANVINPIPIPKPYITTHTNVHSKNTSPSNTQNECNCISTQIKCFILPPIRSICANQITTTAKPTTTIGTDTNQDIIHPTGIITTKCVPSGCDKTSSFISNCDGNTRHRYSHKEIGLAIKVEHPQTTVIRSNKAVPKAVVDEKLCNFEFEHDQYKKTDIQKKQNKYDISEQITIDETSLNGGIKAFFRFFSEFINKSIEKRIYKRDKQMIKVQCEVLKHALPHTYTDTVLVQHTTSVSTVVTKILPQLIRCITYDINTLTASVTLSEIPTGSISSIHEPTTKPIPTTIHPQCNLITTCIIITTNQAGEPIKQ